MRSKNAKYVSILYLSVCNLVLKSAKSDKVVKDLSKLDKVDEVVYTVET